MKPLFTDWNWSPMSIQNVVSVKTKKTPRVIQGTGNVHSYQLGIKFTGRSELRYKGFRIDYGPSTVAYLPKEKDKNIDYTTLTSEVGNGVCIFFDSELPLSQEPQMLTGVSADVENAFLKVLHIYNRTDIYSYPELMESFYSLIVKLRHTDSAYREDKIGERFSPAIEYMQSKILDTYIDISEAARLCGMSDKYFRDLFRKNFGISPLQYFHREKIKNIRTLISDLSLSVAEISAMCGFSDPNYFSRFFKKHFGITPSEYRSNYCKLV